MNSRVNKLEDDVLVLLSSSAQSQRHVKLLEIRNVDQEVGSRRNNLIFRRHVEVAGDDDTVAIFQTFLAYNFDMYGVLSGPIG